MKLTNINPDTLAQLHPEAVERARQDIEYLRRWYAAATDTLRETDNPDAVARGKAIYHRIFAPEAQVRTAGGEGTPLTATGPDGWADVVMNALKDFEATQHLIGTQIVDLLELETDADGCKPTAGRAIMNSYLQAWHNWPDQRLRLVLGTYTDHVRFVPDIGWQIFDMTLHYTAGEERMLGD